MPRLPKVFLPPLLLLLLLLLLSPAAAFVIYAHASDRRDLQLEQQQEALDLSLQHHGMHARRYDTTPADARRIEQLQLQQRLEQQQLELEQARRQRMLERSRPVLGDDDVRRRMGVQRDSFRLERQLQTQRFHLDQQRLIQSLPRRPLQPRATPGQLNLP